MRTSRVYLLLFPLLTFAAGPYLLAQLEFTNSTDGLETSDFVSMSSIPDGGLVGDIYER
ncbi:MAG: hypothetical protein WAO20_14670 [Acidobacteriota bacterium]